MHRLVAAFALLAMSAVSHAQGLVLNDLKAQNAVQLSADELKSLMPSAKVVNYSSQGSTRRWTNEPEGKFTASSNAASVSVGSVRMAQGQGTWHTGDNGTYCVTIEWKTLSENWCLYMFKLGDKYYGVSSAANGASRAIAFEFSK